MRRSIYGNQIFRINNSSKAIKRLIIINVIVFIFANIILSYYKAIGGDGSGFFGNISLSSDIFTVLTKPWTLITSAFVHVGFMHILFNMLYLWWFGKMLQESYGGQAVVSSYVLGALLGSVFYISFYQFLMQSQIGGLAIGASGGVMAVMFSVAAINPDRIVNLFLIGPVKIKWVVLALFILSSVIDFHENIGGKVDHFGGAIFGIIYGYNLRKGKNIAVWFDKLMSFFARIFRIKTNSSINGNSFGFRGMQDRRPKEIRELTKKNFTTKIEAKKEMDLLLDKIKKKGFDKLSETEQNRLKELSKFYE